MSDIRAETEHSTSGAYYAAAPTPTLEQFLGAVCDYEPHRQTPGNVLVEIKIGAWSVLVPFSELYGARDKLGCRS